MKVIFKDVLDYEGYYQISNTGVLRSVPRTISRRDGFLRRVGEKFMYPSIQRITDPKSGKTYSTPVFALRKDLKTELIPAVHMILGAFFPEYEVGTYKVTYKDGDRTNVALNNLKFDFWNGRYGGYVSVKKGRKPAKVYRSIAQASRELKFDHKRLFDKDYQAENLSGFKISFAKEFKRKGKAISELVL